MHSHCAMINVCVCCAKMPSARRLLAAVPSEEGVPWVTKVTIIDRGMDAPGMVAYRL